MNLSQKQQVVARVHEIAATAHCIVAARYTGMSVAQISQLRAKARDEGVIVRVVKNSLARRALADTDFACMDNQLTGPLVLAFSIDDPGAAPRLLSGFAKQNEQLAIQFVAIGGQVYQSSEVERLASLPSRDQAIAMLMSVMQAPMAQLVRALNEVPGKLVRTIAAIRDQKSSS